MSGVIMDKDQRRGAQFQRPAQDLARVDRDMIDRAAPLRLIRDQDILAIEEEDAPRAQALLRASLVVEGGLAIVILGLVAWLGTLEPPASAM